MNQIIQVEIWLYTNIKKVYLVKYSTCMKLTLNINA